jgi:hypothetical protein
VAGCDTRVRARGAPRSHSDVARRWRFDRCVAAREILDREGLTYTDRFGQPKARPEVAIERDGRIAFARLLRELGLDVEPPAETRPPAVAARADILGSADTTRIRRLRRAEGMTISSAARR